MNREACAASGAAHRHGLQDADVFAQAPKRLAYNIKTRRKERGWSLEDFDGILGLHRTCVGSIERCERNVSIDNIETIARAFGVDILQMLEPPPKG